MRYDYTIVGAGITGCTIARVLADAGKKVLIFEKRPHVGGNCYDFTAENGVVVHKYGAHIFHTDHRDVVDFLSRFTEWVDYRHIVLANVDGELIHLPFNLSTLRQVFRGDEGVKLCVKLIKRFGLGAKVPILNMLNDDDPDIQRVAQFVYDKIFVNYTVKQWGLKPDEIDPSVTARVPVFISEHSGYFTDSFQKMPKQGFTAMLERMLKHKNIEVKLGGQAEKCQNLIWTGEVDSLFSFKLGKLPYRSLDFEFESCSEEYALPCAVVNYPNEHGYTRIIEFKHMTGQKCKGTTIAKEYPSEYTGQNEPYYPLFTKEAQELHAVYVTEAEKKGIILAGRLGLFKYFNMDAAVKDAIASAARLL